MKTKWTIEIEPEEITFVILFVEKGNRIKAYQAKPGENVTGIIEDWIHFGQLPMN